MVTESAQTFLACGGMFLLAFFMVWAFWFIERLRGASPQLHERSPVAKGRPVTKVTLGYTTTG
jgi:hypothetical protein